MLPKRALPKAEILIPSLNEKRWFHPFLVAEEKVLLIADEADENKDIVITQTVLDVIKSCYYDERPFDTKKLAAFDIVYIFLKLRAISVSNIMEMRYRDSEDDKVREFTVDLNKLELTTDPEHSNIVEVDDFKIRLKYPSAELSVDIQEGDTITDFIDKVVLNSIDIIYDNETIYEDYTQEELLEFLNTLPSGTYSKIKTFFDTMPKVQHTIRYKNEKGNEVKITLSTLSDFFPFCWQE